jgi:hypothetical protein
LLFSRVGRSWGLSWSPHCHLKNSRVLKKLLAPLLLCTLTVARCCCSCALVVIMGSSSTSSGSIPVLQYPVLFDGTNYRDWVPHIRLHMCGLRLWDFLMGELPFLPRPSAPAKPVLTEKTTATEKEKLLADYEDRLTSYESQFYAYKTWLDEDARASLVLTASMEDRFAADIMEFERTRQMWTFLHKKYESTGQSIYLAVIH